MLRKSLLLYGIADYTLTKDLAIKIFFFAGNDNINFCSSLHIATAMRLGLYNSEQILASQIFVKIPMFRSRMSCILSFKNSPVLFCCKNCVLLVAIIARA